ncbi:hypothetical protein [Paenibacillus xylanexedens]|uniref:hypothetical protein n=1 Tax=Paenibacillus sp. FSL R7-0272 TaxID=2921679 RepID=UPI0012B6CF8D|nr:hypothetical protein [Paenibacillus xylanexedens]
MKHEDDQWEKEIRKGPFATSPFTEDHKRKVLQQVQRIRTVSSKEEEMSEMSPVESSLERSNCLSNSLREYTDTDTNAVKDKVQVKDQAAATKFGPRHQRHRKSRRGILVAGLSALVIAGGLFMWNWHDGQLAKPLMEQINPASALLFTDHLNVDILTDQMKKNVAMTMRDDLGKQLRITKVQDLPVSGRIYVEAGQEKGAGYAQIWLDAKTGNLREVQMRAEMQPSKLEHRYTRQIPSLLEGMGMIPTLQPVKVRRSVGMQQGKTEPTSYTVVDLREGDSYGEIIWRQDQAISITGELRADQISQTEVAKAKRAIEVFSGKANFNLEDASRIKDDEIGEDSTFFSFSDNYFVKITEAKNGSRYMVGDSNDYGYPQINSPEQMEAYQDQLLNMDENLLRERVGPFVKNIFNVDLDDYRVHRDAEKIDTVTFERDAKDAFEVRYEEDGRITMITKVERKILIKYFK